MYIDLCTLSTVHSYQTLPQVAVAVAGGIHDEDKDAVHVWIEVAEHSFRELERRCQIVCDVEAAVPKILACPQAVRQCEAVDSEEGNGFERDLGELSVLKIA